MSTSATLVVLYCTATAIALAVRRVRLPYTAALVLAGLALGSLTRIEPPRLTQELLFTFFLPGLLFEAAFHLDHAALQRVWRSVVALAVPGVMLATTLTAAIVVLFAGALGVASVLEWRVAIVFGAIIAATDPVAVTAAFRDLGAPSRLRALIEGESLLNDGTGVVLFSLVVAYFSGAPSSLISFASVFAMVAAGGVLIGLLVGAIVSFVIHRVDDPMIEIALTMIAAYGSFVCAESLHVSGVLATVAAGVLCGRHGRDAGMSEASRAATQSFWDYVAFALNSIVFLLLGFEFEASRFVTFLPQVVLAFVAMLLARGATVALVVLLMRRTKERIPASWGVITVWGGLRGALSMVLALALPQDFPQRALIVTLVSGAVLLSVLVQGLSMPLLLRALSLDVSADVADGTDRN